jgi:large subunit ribosomal protein L19
MVSQVMDKINKQSLMEGRATAFRVGDTILIHVKIKEGDKDRIQIFKGIVIARKGRGATESFTVRRVSHGVGVERVFPVHSPHIANIEVESSAIVRRAKLYHLRDLGSRKVHMKLRRD